MNKVDQNFNYQTVEECFKFWISKDKKWKEIPSFICWEIWNYKNSILFEFWKVVNSLASSYEEFCKSVVKPKMRI